MNRAFLFYLIILCEGYAVLSAELIAIRQTMPYVGSGAETVAIIISAVLLPLAFGYHHGGKLLKVTIGRGKAFSIRRRLVRNFTIAAFFLLFGLSYMTIAIFFEAMNTVGITNRILQVACYATLWLVTPTYLLGQTVPLISNYFRKQSMAEAAGRILFVSTAGSFMGAMAASLLFMPLFGVGYTVIVNLLLLVVLAVVLAPRRGRFWRVLPICFCGVLAVWANNHYALQGIGVIRDNEYNTIRVHTIEKEQSRILELNRTGASKYAENIEFRFPYIAYLQRNFLDHLAFADEPKDILVIGAGGFVLGLEDGYNRYTFVDIDDDLLEVSETYLLQQKLGENKVFYPEPARGFLARDTKQYDMVLLDVYTNIHGIPPQLLTMEFLQELRDKLKMKGVLVANIVTTANFSERFSIAFDNTFRQVFSHFTRQVVQDFNPWSADDRDYQNILYIYQNLEYGDAVYTDDKNTLVYDRALKANETAKD